jgi:hypothetical protein
MPDVSLEVTVPLDETSRRRLGEIFDVRDGDLDEVLSQLAAASLTEYLLAFAGDHAPTSMRELRELRLRLLYRHMSDDLPTDEQVQELFQLTPTQVGTLIAGTRARFSTEIGDRLRAAAVSALTRQATNVDTDTIRLVLPNSLARYMKDLVNTTAAPPLAKRKDASRTYDVGRGTTRALCTRLGVDPTQVTALDWPDS